MVRRYPGQGRLAGSLKRDLEICNIAGTANALCRRNRYWTIL